MQLPYSLDESRTVVNVEWLGAGALGIVQVAHRKTNRTYTFCGGTIPGNTEKQDVLRIVDFGYQISPEYFRVLADRLALAEQEVLSA